jgi:hypothetical protein
MHSQSSQLEINDLSDVGVEQNDSELDAVAGARQAVVLIPSGACSRGRRSAHGRRTGLRRVSRLGVGLFHLPRAAGPAFHDEGRAAHAHSVAYGPIIFQSYVPKRIEVRVTVVGARVFAAEAASPTRRLQVSQGVRQCVKAWILDSGSSLHALEDLATNRARVAKLRDRIAGERVDGFFEAHRGDFETIAVALLTTPSKRIAADIASAIASSQVRLL